MNGLLTGFFIFYLINVLFGGILEGSGGINATKLTTGLTVGGGTITVVSTEGFDKANYVVIENEHIRYVNKTATTFVVATSGRGYHNTTAVAHATGTMVYSPQAATMNDTMGFNVVSTEATFGGMAIPTMLTGFVTSSLGKFITWDFPQYRVSEWAQYIRYILALCGAGFAIYLILTIAPAVGGVLQGIWNLFTR